jgi:1-acyl-sn-glycerol-3-phosphate acyltransferase
MRTSFAEDATMDLWYSLAKTIVGTYLTLCVESIHIEGQENLTAGPKIIVANHANASDAFVIPFIVPEKVHFLIQEDILRVPLFGHVLAWADQIPVVVGRGREALDAARDRLARGNAVAIFPEGRLSHGDSFRRAGAGAALLALESRVPLVPVGFYVAPRFTRTIQGRFHGRDSIGRWQLGGRCFVRVGQPWWPSPAAAEAEGRYRSLRRVTRRVMDQIAELVGQAAEEAQRS